MDSKDTKGLILQQGTLHSMLDFQKQPTKTRRKKAAKTRKTPAKSRKRPQIQKTGFVDIFVFQKTTGLQSRQSFYQNLRGIVVRRRCLQCFANAVDCKNLLSEKWPLCLTVDHLFVTHSLPAGQTIRISWSHLKTPKMMSTLSFWPTLDYRQSLSTIPNPRINFLKTRKES